MVKQTSLPYNTWPTKLSLPHSTWPNNLLYPTDKVALGVYRSQLVLLSFLMFCKHDSSSTDEPMLMNLLKVVVYYLRMCIKEDNPHLKYFQGDIKKCGTGGILL